MLQAPLCQDAIMIVTGSFLHTGFAVGIFRAIKGKLSDQFPKPDTFFTKIYEFSVIV